MCRNLKPTLRWAAIVGSAAIIAAIVALYLEVRLLTQPTTPRAVNHRAGTERLLVVLDVQEDYTGPRAPAPFPYRGARELIARVNELTARAVSAGWRVVYVRQTFRRPLSRLLSRLVLSGTALAESPGAAFDSRLTIASPHSFEKPFADAFSSVEFEAFVLAHSAVELALVGLDGAGCIDATARGARNRGLAVVVLEDAVLARDVEKWDALKREYSALGIRVTNSRDAFATP